MKVLFLAAQYWPHVGGVEKHVWRVSQELVKLGHQVTVITNQNAKHAQEPGIQVVHIPAQVRDHKLKTWLFLLSYQELFASADVIHVHDVMWWLWPTWWRWSYKLYITFHGWETKWPIPWQNKVQRRFANRISRGSIHIGTWIAKYYGDTPTQVVYGGTDIRPLSLPKVKPKVLKCLFVGRLSSDNQVSWYCDLLEELHKEFPDVEMTWVGDGALATLARKVGKVVGWQQQPDKYLHQADVVFANSYLSLLDAQAAGKLVVCATAHPLKKAYSAEYPGLRWLMTGEQPRQVATNIVAFLSDFQMMRDYLKAQSAWVVTQTWQQVAEQYLELWGVHEN